MIIMVLVSGPRQREV